MLVYSELCLFAVEQVVVAQWLFTAFSVKTAACCVENDIMRALSVNQNSKVTAGQLNDELKLTINLCYAEGSCRIADYPLLVILIQDTLRNKVNINIGNTC